ncbi:DUF397 domain-containing protein [Streptomyces zagrosensis]|uniref:DUF397 domain-containing protein n=1 Tax=Streptomyces zagrosensis TaxID=1042984 RepID=A0A7W9Q4V5_9ACTN|nr:DUF397 domain-containing protein [Streptomyces zagrosensis]MBB5933641.1 hypothetical protein [Streptomyces zagrosensis]
MIMDSSRLAGWVKSSHSGVENACVEWAPSRAAEAGGVPVRDSKDPHGPALVFDAAAWSSFVAGVKAGELA